MGKFSSCLPFVGGNRIYNYVCIYLGMIFGLAVTVKFMNIEECVGETKSPNLCM